MASSDSQFPSQAESQMYEAAESMLEHSRVPRPALPSNLNGYGLPENHLAQLQPQSDSVALVPISPYPNVSLPFQNSASQRHQDYASTIDGVLHSPQNHGSSDYRARKLPTSERLEGGGHDPNARQHRQSNPSPGGYAFGNHNGSVDGSEPNSPTSSRGRTAHSSEVGAPYKHRSSHDELREDGGVKKEHKSPAWKEMKTKAGKDRKRLPLACIACRRKKIRCSGEKPACKHCLRSRIPCVYKVTARKAAPRTDYMAMLDKRLKRMEDRVIKIIPKDEKDEASVIPRAIVKPPHPGTNPKSSTGKKRAACEAFGLDGNDWAENKMSAPPPMADASYNEKLNEGIEKLPSKEIQEHLSEVFFDCLYGQSYHLLHKPSYIRRLRAGKVPPVLVLAVCAISARFSTHPQLGSEPAFLRGEEWASPAREIALKRYDEPSMTTLTVFLILGLHEFGTCHGGRSWMFGGMALRMAYALQLHRELKYDPSIQADGKNTELSCTDREIRRRTMWACFQMDRFNSSGTERPASANEENLKIQLPIKENYFQMDIPGPTEFLDGTVPKAVGSNDSQANDNHAAVAKENMGVAAYLVRIVALWGRLVNYINQGGRERDGHPFWDPKSQFAELRQQVEGFRASLPPLLQYTQDNLKKHAVDRVANQFLVIHIACNQLMLFLHRFAIPTAPGGKIPEKTPKTFVAEARTIAVDAATNISTLLDDALEHHVTAPFTGYCAFLSSVVHVWGVYSKSATLEASSKANLARNVKYLQKMKKHWGMFHFIAQNLKEIFARHTEFAKGSGSESAIQDASVFQYGDWFQKYPHGVSETDYEDPASTKIKQEGTNNSSLSQQSDLQSVEEFFHALSSPARTAQQRTAPKKRSRSGNQAEQVTPLQPLNLISQPSLANSQQHPQPDPNQPMLPLSAPIVRSPVSSSPYTPQHQPQPQPQHQQHQNLYTPTQPLFPQSYDMLSLPSSANTTTFPQPLDRHLLYGGYTGADSVPVPVLGTNPNELANSAATQDQNQMWSATSAMDLQQQMMAAGAGGYGDSGLGAWFMPFNMEPPIHMGTPDMGGEGDFGGGGGGFVTQVQGDQGMQG